MLEKLVLTGKRYRKRENIRNQNIRFRLFQKNMFAGQVTNPEQGNLFEFFECLDQLLCTRPFIHGL